MIVSAEMREAVILAAWKSGGEAAEQTLAPRAQSTTTGRPRGLFWNKHTHATPSTALISNVLSRAVPGWLQSSVAAGLC